MLSTPVKNKNEYGIYLKKSKKIKNILVTFWGYIDKSNKWLIYPYTFLYIIINPPLSKKIIFIYTQLVKKNLLWKIQHVHLSHSFMRD